MTRRFPQVIFYGFTLVLTMLLLVPTAYALKLAPAKKCGSYYEYIDSALLNMAGCQGGRCVTYSTTPPDADVETITEAFTMKNLTGMAWVPLYRDRVIPRYRLYTVSFEGNIISPLSFPTLPDLIITALTTDFGDYVQVDGERFYCEPFHPDADRVAMMRSKWEKRMQERRMRINPGSSSPLTVHEALDLKRLKKAAHNILELNQCITQYMFQKSQQLFSGQGNEKTAFCQCIYSYEARGGNRNKPASDFALTYPYHCG